MTTFSSLVGHEIVVPGSVSNLGPGFDTLSVAVQVYLRVRIVDVREGVPDTIETKFTNGAPGGENRIETAFRHARARIGKPRPRRRARGVERDPDACGPREQRRGHGRRPAAVQAS